MSDSTCATALFDYTATEENEISFSVGELLTHVQQVDADWWKGQIGQQSGLFPANHVQLIQ